MIACDGLCDVASTNEIGEAIVKMRLLNKSPAEMSQQLVFGALKSDSGDNVSVIVAALGKPKIMTEKNTKPSKNSLESASPLPPEMVRDVATTLTIMG